MTNSSTESKLRGKNKGKNETINNGDLCWAAAVAQVLPGDGESLTVYRLETEIGDGSAGICDLSGASVSGETEMRFEYYGDTLVRRVAGPCADWLRISGDTIRSIGGDTRRDNIRYSRGVPYLLPCQSADSSDSLRHSVFMTVDRDNMVSCRYSSRPGCGFILPGGDTIQSTYCVETEVCDSAATVRHRRWYADGAVWSVVDQVDVHAADGEYHTVNICPAGNRSVPRSAAKSRNGRQAQQGVYGMLARLHGTDPTYPSLPSTSGICQYTITSEPEGISVTGEDTDRALARLFDASGRMWHEGAAAETIPTSHLAAGVYLLQISSAEESYTVKLTVTGR